MKSEIYTFLLLLTLCNPSLAQDLNLQLESYYDFENNVDDQSGNNNNLSVLKGNPTYIDFNGGKAISLDGNTQLTTTNPFDVSHSDSFAISVVFRTSTITNDLQTILQGANIGFGVFIEANTGRLYTFLDKSSADPILSENSIADGQWHHAVVSSNGIETFLFLDGVFQGSRSEILDVGNGANDNKLFIGQTNLGTRGYTGDLDEVRVYSRELTPCDRIDLTLSYFEPKGIFDFDGNLEDESFIETDFEVTNGQITYETFAPGDEAIVFDGNTRIASINSFDNSDFQNIAISFWFRAEATKDHRQALIQGANMGAIIFIEEDTGVLKISFDGSSAESVSSINPVTDGEWHHLAAMSTGSSTIIILDGNYEGFRNEVLVTGNGASDNKWYMGQTNLNQWPFTGAVNELIIFDHILELCQIGRAVEMGPVSSAKELIQIEPNFSISPNPSNGEFVIDFNKNHLPENIQVYDLNGKIIFSDDKINNSKYELSINQPAGIYILKTISDLGFSTKKLIKK